MTSPLVETTEPYFTVAVVKIASRCNLDCKYCYVYHAGDTSYRERPRFMNPATFRMAVERMRDHCLRHGLREIAICFHGGEPLLVPRARLREFVMFARAAFAPEVMVRFVLQTNGVLLDQAWCEMLRELDVRVGVSIDGPAAVHDRQRVDRLGAGSHAAVLRGWQCAVRSGLQPGILTVVDPTADPVSVHDHLAKLSPRRVDLLLPAATYEHPPPRRTALATPYGDWLLAFFERWAARDEPAFRVRMFDNIIAAVFGLGAGTDSLGSGDNGVVVIETDGAIEPVDVLRACEPGMTRTALSVLANDLDEAFAQPLVREYFFSHKRLPARCRRCSVQRICGGGYLSHRFSKQRAFDNPSVYCFDLLRLIARVQGWVVDSLTDEVRAATGLVALDFARERDRLARDAAAVSGPAAGGPRVALPLATLTL